MSEPKYTWKNRISLIEYSSTEVLDPSEVSQFVGKLIFKLVKEV